jgi:hypothetical protein
MATPQPVISRPISNGHQIVIKDSWLPREVEDALKHKKSYLATAVRQVLTFLPRDMPSAREAAMELITRLSACVVMESNLHLTVLRGRHSLLNWNDRRPIEDCGWVGWKVITTAGVNFLVDAWQNSVELEILKYHGIGTGSTAEAAGDTALVTELTTEYNPDSTRATGTLTEGASANIFRTVGTNTLDGTPGAALREHGIFSAAAAGTLWDRTIYSSITLSSGDSLQSTYDATVSSGG